MRKRFLSSDRYEDKLFKKAHNYAIFSRIVLIAITKHFIKRFKLKLLKYYSAKIFKRLLKSFNYLSLYFKTKLQ